MLSSKEEKEGSESKIGEGERDTDVGTFVRIGTIPLDEGMSRPSLSLKVVMVR